MIMNTVSLANGKAAAKLISGNGISLVLETTLNDKIAYTNKLGVNCWSFERFTFGLILLALERWLLQLQQTIERQI
jgi:hypothetical protein